jgi:hypothetical protein
MYWFNFIVKFYTEYSDILIRSRERNCFQSNIIIFTNWENHSITAWRAKWGRLRWSWRCSWRYRGAAATWNCNNCLLRGSSGCWSRPTSNVFGFYFLQLDHSASGVFQSVPGHLQDFLRCIPWPFVRLTWMIFNVTLSWQKILAKNFTSGNLSKVIDLLG